MKALATTLGAIPQSLFLLPPPRLQPRAPTLKGVFNLRNSGLGLIPKQRVHAHDYAGSAEPTLGAMAFVDPLLRGQMTYMYALPTSSQDPYRAQLKLSPTGKWRKTWEETLSLVKWNPVAPISSHDLPYGLAS